MPGNHICVLNAYIFPLSGCWQQHQILKAHTHSLTRIQLTLHGRPPFVCAWEQFNGRNSFPCLFIPFVDNWISSFDILLSLFSSLVSIPLPKSVCRIIKSYFLWMASRTITFYWYWEMEYPTAFRWFVSLVCQCHSKNSPCPLIGECGKYFRWFQMDSWN